MLNGKSDRQIETMVSQLTMEEVITSAQKSKGKIPDKSKTGQDSLHTSNPLDNLLLYENTTTAGGIPEDAQQSSELLLKFYED